jgi:hypothetical protein
MKRILGLGIMALAAVAFVSAQDATPKAVIGGTVSSGIEFQSHSVNDGNTTTTTKGILAGTGEAIDGNDDPFTFNPTIDLTAGNYGLHVDVDYCAATADANNVYLAKPGLNAIYAYGKLFNIVKLSAGIDNGAGQWDVPGKTDDWFGATLNASVGADQQGFMVELVPTLPNDMTVDLGGAIYDGWGMNGNGQIDYSTPTGGHTPWGAFGIAFKMPSMVNINVNMAITPNSGIYAGSNSLAMAYSDSDGLQKYNGDSLSFFAADVNVGPMMAAKVSPSFDTLAIGFVGANLNDKSDTGTQTIGMDISAGWNSLGANGPLTAGAAIYMFFRPDVKAYWGNLGYDPIQVGTKSIGPSTVKYSDRTPQFGLQLSASYKVFDWLTPKAQFNLEMGGYKNGSDRLTQTYLSPQVELDFTIAANSNFFVGWNLASTITTATVSGWKNTSDTMNYFIFGVQSKF